MYIYIYVYIYVYIYSCIHIYELDTYMYSFQEANERQRYWRLLNREEIIVANESSEIKRHRPAEGN